MLSRSRVPRQVGRPLGKPLLAGALALILALSPGLVLADPRSEPEHLRALLREALVANHSLAQQLEKLRAQYEASQARLARLEAQTGAAERIIRQYAGGVAFIQGAFQLTDAGGRPLRHAASPVDTQGTISVLSTDGAGSEITFEFTGTGFLVSAEGLLLTNRHVVEPWGESERVQGLLRAGFRPRLTFLRAFFPSRPEPFPLEIVALAPDTDVALLRLDPRGAKFPVLPLASPEERSAVGAPVLLLGYPAGLAALVAKAELRPSAAIQEDQMTARQVAESLARRGLIRPLSTQGHIGDLLPHQIVYDALTTVGGSGGPLFSLDGKVIGINYAILSNFPGSSFALPIQWGADLLGAAKLQARPAAARIGSESRSATVRQ